MFLLLPLACVYYPVAMLPAWLQSVAWALPPTYVFEGMRALLIEHVFRADLMRWALASSTSPISRPRLGVFLLLMRQAREAAEPAADRRMTSGCP